MNEKYKVCLAETEGMTLWEGLVPNPRTVMALITVYKRAPADTQTRNINKCEGGDQHSEPVAKTDADHKW